MKYKIYPSESHRGEHETPHPRVMEVNDFRVVVIETEHCVSHGAHGLITSFLGIV
jgi:hypothetical protein